MYTVGVLMVGLLWMTGAYREVRSLKEEAASQTDKLAKLEDDKRRKEEEIVTKTHEIDVLNHILENTRFSGKISTDELERVKVESDKAQQELTKLEFLKPERLRRSNIAVQYYSRVIDKQYLESAMTRLGDDYGFRTLPPRPASSPNTPTNAIWINRSGLTDEDVKLVAYHLIRAGVTVRYIGPPTSTCDKFKGSYVAIIVVAEPKVSDKKPLGVDTIRGLSLKEMKAGTTKVDCH